MAASTPSARFAPETCLPPILLLRRPRLYPPRRCRGGGDPGPVPRVPAAAVRALHGRRDQRSAGGAVAAQVSERNRRCSLTTLALVTFGEILVTLVTLALVLEPPAERMPLASPSLEKRSLRRRARRALRGCSPFTPPRISPRSRELGFPGQEVAGTLTAKRPAKRDCRLLPLYRRLAYAQFSAVRSVDSAARYGHIPRPPCCSCSVLSRSALAVSRTGGPAKERA
eukprot:716624-Prorocentrum_minimum.AAC.2